MQLEMKERDPKLFEVEKRMTVIGLVIYSAGH